MLFKYNVKELTIIMALIGTTILNKYVLCRSSVALSIDFFDHTFFLGVRSTDCVLLHWYRVLSVNEKRCLVTY